MAMRLLAEQTTVGPADRQAAQVLSLVRGVHRPAACARKLCSVPLRGGAGHFLLGYHYGDPGTLLKPNGNCTRCSS